MAKENFKKSSKKEGLPPGTIVHTGKIKKDLVKIRLIECDEKHFSDAEVPLSFIKKNNKKKMWINLDGVHNTRLIAEIGEKFGIHNLVLEDIADVTQRPKIEDYENYVYIVARMIYLNPKENQYGQTDYPANKSSTPGKKSNSQIENRIISEQISFIIGKNYLISFQENTGDVFDKVRERMKN
ncbi:MAG: CorA family divalent cation transporter, partial [Candidatus Paceibacterota bacterium]